MKWMRSFGERVTATGWLAGACVAAMLGVSVHAGQPATPAPAAGPAPRALYTTALAREQAVRPALADEHPSPATLKEARATVFAYDAIVRKFPASGYADDALWQGGRLALDVFAKSNEPRDRETGHRLLKLLASDYQLSKFAKQVPAELQPGAAAAKPANATAAPAPRPAPATPPAPATATPRPPTPAPPATRPANAPAPTPQTPPAPSAVRPATPLSPARPTEAAPGTAPARKGGSDADARPVAPAAAVLVKDVRRTPLQDLVRVTIELDAEVTYHDERIASPERLFVDLPGTRTPPALTDATLRFDGDNDPVHQIRLGRPSAGVTRVVLDTAGVSGCGVYALYDPYRVVVDCPKAAVASAPAPVATQASTTPRPQPVPEPRKAGGRAPRVAPPVSRTSDMAAATEPAPLEARRLLPGSARYSVGAVPTGEAALAAARGLGAADTLMAMTAPTVAPFALPAPSRPTVVSDALPSAAASTAATAASAPARQAPSAPAPVTPPAPATASIAAPPALPGGLSMARQLGLGVSRIVIDPGHGGHDPGASGKGVTEAELVLDVALRVRALLQKQGGIDVILTRATDEFIPLPERTAIANREGADLFLSIHANASPSPQAHGVETYFLNFANTLSASAVATRENAASGQAMGALPDFVKAIALNNKLDESRTFATLVQREMLQNLRGQNKLVQDLGVKQAPFVVLIGAAMPSVLAEISFVTNPNEAKLLKSNAYRQKIAEALVAGVRRYQSSLKGAATLASQYNTHAGSQPR